MSSIKEKIINYSVERYRLVSLFTLIAVIISAFFLSNMVFDTDPENMLLETEPARIFHNNTKKNFMLSDTIVVGILNEKNANGVFNVETLGKIYEITEFARGLKWEDSGKEYGFSGVIEADILAPSVIDHMSNKGEGVISFEWLMASPPKTEKEALEIKDKVFSNQLLRGQMVSEDSNVLCLYLPVTEKLLSYKIYKLLKEKIDSFDKGQEEFHIAGLPVAEGAIGVEMFTQMSTASPLAMGVILFLLFIFFRKPVLIILPMIISTISIMITMGTMNASGFPVHILSSMLPIFLMSISMVDCVHVLSEFFDTYTEEKGRKETIKEVMNTLYKPMLYTSITTAAGFLSLILAPIPPARVFGGFLSIGVMTAWFLTIVFVPAYIMLIPKKYLKNFGIKSNSKENFLTKILRFQGKFTFSNSGKIIFFFAIILVIASWGISIIKINDNYAKRFDLSHPVRIADIVFNEHLKGIYTAYLVGESEKAGLLTQKDVATVISRIDNLSEEENPYQGNGVISKADVIAKLKDIALKSKTKKDFYNKVSSFMDMKIMEAGENYSSFLLDVNDIIDSEKESFKIFKDPETINYISDLQDFLNKNEITGKSQSVSDIVKKVNQELRTGDEKDFAIPKTQRGISECYFQYQQSHRPNDLWHYVTPDFMSASIRMQFKTGDSMNMKDAVKAVDSYTMINKPPHDLKFKWAGLHYINLVLEKRLVLGFLKSFAGSFLIVFLMMSFLFRSVKWGFLCMIPLSATLGIIYGIIGIIGKDYDLPVAVLSALSIGMAVDFAIHFLERARNIYKEKGSWELTYPEMFKEPARAITRNVLIIAVGFLPLLTASLIPYKTTGLMLFSIMLFSGFLTLIILPACLKNFEGLFFKKEDEVLKTVELEG